MPERWTADVRPAPVPVTGAVACELVRSRLATGDLMTWFESDRGRLLAFGSNGARVMLMLLDGPEDPGENATSPQAHGDSTGYVLDNGQVDTYPDTDTVPVQEALDNLAHLIDQGRGLPGTAWSSNR